MNKKIVSHRYLYHELYHYPRIEFIYKDKLAPTIYDELLLELAVVDYGLKEKTLLEVTNQLAAPKSFISYTLQNLIETGNLEKVAGSTDKLEEIKLADLKPTKHGLTAYEQKYILSKDKNEDHQFYINPITGKEDRGIRARSRGKVALIQNIPELAKDHISSIFEQRFWNYGHSDSVLVDYGGVGVTCDRQTFIREVEVELQVDNNDNLLLTFFHKLKAEVVTAEKLKFIPISDSSYQEWLDKNQPSFVVKNVIGPLLQAGFDSLQQAKPSRIKYDKDAFVSLQLADENIAEEKYADCIEIRHNYNLAKSDESAPTSTKPLAKNTSSKSSEKEQVTALNFPTPLIVFNDNEKEISLVGKVLFCPTPTNIKFASEFEKGFFSPKNGNFFEVISGIYQATYAHTETVDLPITAVKNASTQTNQALAEYLGQLCTNPQALAFLAKFYTASELADNITEIFIKDVKDIKDLVKTTWEIDFIPEAWIPKIKPLAGTLNIKTYSEIFGTEVAVQQLDQSKAALILDFALNGDKDALKVTEFNQINQAIKVSFSLDTSSLNVKEASKENVNRAKEVLAYLEKLKEDYAFASDSKKLAEKEEQIQQWFNHITSVFEPEHANTKYAVLDTNYVINHQDKLAQINNQSTIILPTVVLSELDKLKGDSNKRHLELEKEIDNLKKEIAQLEIDIPSLEERLATNKTSQTKLEQEKASLEKEIKGLEKTKLAIVDKLGKEKDQKAKEDLTKQLDELKTKEDSLRKDLTKTNKELEEIKKQINKDTPEFNRLKKSHTQAISNRNGSESQLAEVRNKLSKITNGTKALETLEIAVKAEEAHELILAHLAGNKDSKNSADDHILAVTLRYRLNEVYLYSDDRNLKLKASGYKIKSGK